MWKKTWLWVIAASVSMAVSFGSPAAAVTLPQAGQQAVAQPAQERAETGDDEGLWGLLGLVGLLGLFGLVRRGPRRDRKNALAGYSAEKQPPMPNANAAYTPPRGLAIPPIPKGVAPAPEVPAQGSGALASDNPPRRWP
jgi:MYXO-CTERM domain-containing protein